MKKVLLLFVGIFIASISFEQINKDSLTNVLADEVCHNLDSLSKESYFKGVFLMRFELALMISMDNHKEQLEKLFGEYEYGDDSSRVLANKVGVVLIFKCPKFTEEIEKNKKEIAKQKEHDKTHPPHSIQHGILTKIVNDDFTYLEFKTTYHGILKTYWFKYFEGADELLKNQSNFIDKWLKIEYEEIRKFNYLNKTYEKIKVIKSIKLD